MIRLGVMLITDGSRWWSARPLKVFFAGGPNVVHIFFLATGLLAMVITRCWVWGGQIRTIRGFMEANWDRLATIMVMIMMMMTI
jgi:hypothetical protein